MFIANSETRTENSIFTSSGHPLTFIPPPKIDGGIVSVSGAGDW